MKEKYEFHSNDMDSLVDFFGAVETIESVFKIRFAWVNGSFEDCDEGDGSVDASIVKYDGKVFTEPGVLTITYDDDGRKFIGRSFGSCWSEPKVKLKNGDGINSEEENRRRCTLKGVGNV